MADDGRSERWSAVGWAVLIAGLSSAGLAGLSWFLVTMDVLVALGLGLVSSMDQAGVPEGVPILDGYGRALVFGVVVNLVGAVAVALIAGRTVARSWPAWVTGLSSGVVAVLVAGSVQLIALGINPVAFVTGL